MPAKKTIVLAVDDEKRVLRLLEMSMEAEGYKVFTAGDGETALNILFGEEEINLVLLDIGLPDIDGCEICRRIRKSSQVPIIMVTAKDTDEEKVCGLDSGADDYITKPFSASELAARIRAVLRRTKVTDEYRDEPVFKIGDLLIDFQGYIVTIGDKNIDLSATEFSILSYLAHNSDRVVTSDQILSKIWGESYTGETSILQASIMRLRKKLGDNVKNPKYITTKPGIGYKMTGGESKQP